MKNDRPMRFALSTNWCHGAFASAGEIAEKAADLGFDALELGFRTSGELAEDFRRLRDAPPIGSVHAFCPVPISAPSAHPELYSLASFDEAQSRIARVHVIRCVEFASSVGASALVLHAGRVSSRGLFGKSSLSLRRKRGRKLLDRFKSAIESLVPVLEANSVRIGLENLPYLEGFPDETEMSRLCGEWVRPWLDTGHDHVRKLKGWKDGGASFSSPLGMHLNDSKGGDDHLAPGEGDIDFTEYRDAARSCSHLVLEPAPSVPEESLRRSLAHLKRIWSGGTS